MGSTHIAISSVTFDSRKVKKDTLFVATRGTATDGHKFIEKAIEAGAAAIVCDITLTEENSDAIHVAAEHRSGAVFAAVLPYAPNRENGEWEFGDLAADANEPVVWVD